jgi:hypothetical protein
MIASNSGGRSGRSVLGGGKLPFVHREHDLEERCVRAERQAPCHAEIEHDAERVLIGAAVEVLVAEELLGRAIRGRADERVRDRDLPGRVAEHLRDAEVEDLRLDAAVRCLGEEDVRGFQVAVEHADAVRVRDGHEHRHHQDRALARAQRADALQVAAQRLALEELHDEEAVALVRPDVGDVDDVRVPDARGRLAFEREALDDVVALGEVVVEHLHRDFLLQGGVLGHVHVGHAAPADPADQPIIAELESRSDGHGRVHRARGVRTHGRHSTGIPSGRSNGRSFLVL